MEENTNRKPVRCLLIEDDPVVREVVTQFIEMSDGLELTATANDHPAALHIIRQQVFDLIITDVETRLLNGVDFIRSLPNSPLVIFITSHPQYAVEGFEVNAVDFLLKPFTFSRFQKAIQKVENLLHPLFGQSMDEPKELEVHPDYTFIRSEQQFVKIIYADVLYIEALKDYTRLVMADGQQHLTWMNLKNIEDTFPADRFQRIHKSYIVNKPHIRSIGNDTVFVEKKEIPLGHSYKPQFMAGIEKNLTKRNGG